MVTNRKKTGAYFTPERVAATLVRWAVRSREDRLLDPACGDGRFLVAPCQAVGVEQNKRTSALVRLRAPRAKVVVSDFFTWVDTQPAKFDCVVGNPPFIRYQHFTGAARDTALDYCSRQGANFSRLCSSWAPFLVAAATILKPGGRLAFVVPAEIGHAPYAVPLMYFLLRRFRTVQLIAIRDKLFPRLSEDAWLLFASGYGESTDEFLLTVRDRFVSTTHPPAPDVAISAVDWEQWDCRIRPFLLSSSLRRLLSGIADSTDVLRLGDIAQVSIGYVTGANEFFHLRPSESARRRIPDRFLLPAVRRGAVLPPRAVTHATVAAWIQRDAPVLLLRIEPRDSLPKSVCDYLDSPAGQRAQEAYKCRVRTPWYAVPGLRVPTGFLSYMSGAKPSLVFNAAKCVCTNAVHAVYMRAGNSFLDLQRHWEHPLTRLSCELQGHPLGGGVLKLEPGEASRVMIPRADLRVTQRDKDSLLDGVNLMKRWRHYENGSPN